ncbi:lipase family protein [Paucibacter sp. DJ2R-2]|uniref:lipase family protein n=1 Tax=Paucibacter sp. DJ2R-2 TaxID=2893558 RepID=UPI0021E3F8CE|nr:lipase family protein [Paucibacter sp. DJ2R-2]MCV2420519.1 lipase family protein [Paucibacter sp. DJ4R-1]MCV2439697.1 lipase family protein [Paucibacter sp. DJ2R-2]
MDQNSQWNISRLRLCRRLSVLLCAAALSACSGSGGSSPNPVPEPVPVPVPPVETILNATGPGEWRQTSLLRSIPVGEIAAVLQAAGARAPQLTPRYEVRAYRLEYLTRDGQGREVLASGLVAVPLKPAGAPSPVLSYQHATLMHEREAPSNQAVASEAVVMMASAGYIVVAADYIGYGVSKQLPHPYLQAAPSASAVNDLLTAARYWRYSAGIADNRQLFMGGYSQGGYVTMAAHRALQNSQSPLRLQLLASAPGAGAYSVSATLDDLLRQVKEKNATLGTLLNPGVLRFLSDNVRQRVRDELLKLVVDEDSDIRFDPRFIDLYLADDSASLKAESDVHDWAPQKPVYLFHGREDRTVPYLNASLALDSMARRGAGQQVSLNACPSQPSGHIDCVLPYWNFMLQQFAGLARDL